MLFALLGLHAVLAAIAPSAYRRLGRHVFLLAGLAPAATVVYVLWVGAGVVGGDPVAASFAWAPELGLTADLRLDAFATVMVLLVSGIGVGVFVYAVAYFESDAPQPKLGRFAGVLTAFAGSMLGLVLADNVLLLYVFWELTSITSYLLIGYEDRKPEARSAALQALLTTTLGGLAMLGGFVLVAEAAGTYSLSGILTAPPSGTAVNVGLVVICVGAFTKSAQVPFHTWLPSAMLAPTPVSAYLHSATMVKGGVYLIARLAPAFAAVAVWRPLVIGVGVATMLIGGYRALRQHDLKLLLAFGTISQLGFMVALFGAGVPQATFAATVLLLAHGLFKAPLFMVVGIVDHAAHTRDLRRLTGLWRQWPWVFATAAVAGASMAGLPPLFGFISKEAGYDAFVHVGPSWGPWALAGIVAGSVLTFAYTGRFLLGGFGDKRGGADLRGPHLQRPSQSFAGPAALLSAATVLLGLVPSIVDPLVNEAAVVLAPSFETEHLALWHGFTAALWLSLLTIALGVLLMAARHPVEGLQSRLALPWGAREAYDAIVTGLLRGSNVVTGIVQPGSLPFYLSVIIATGIVLPAAHLLGATLPSAPPATAGAVQTIAGVVIVAAVIATVFSPRRFSAVLLLGGAGYGVGVLFIVQGAPDLALTQFLIETLTLIIFVLVLRHLPDRFTRRPRFSRLARSSIALVVGVFVMVFALVAAAARRAPPVSQEYLARAYSEADGANVVNVILVDFRGLDTLGEITVLVVAGLGIAALVLSGRLEDQRAQFREPAERLDDERARP